MTILFNVGCNQKYKFFFKYLFLLHTAEPESWGGGSFSFCGFYDTLAKKKLINFSNIQFGFFEQTTFYAIFCLFFSATKLGLIRIYHLQVLGKNYIIRKLNGMLVVKLCVARFPYKCKKFGWQNNIVSRIFNTEIKSLIRDVIQSCFYFLLNGETNMTCTTLHVKLHTS